MLPRGDRASTVQSRSTTAGAKGERVDDLLSEKVTKEVTYLSHHYRRQFSYIVQSEKVTTDSLVIQLDLRSDGGGATVSLPHHVQGIVRRSQSWTSI